MKKLNSNKKSLPTLRYSLTPSDTTMALTELGFAIQRTETLINIYAEKLSWENTKEIWHDERLSGRGSRKSAQAVFRVIRDRFKQLNQCLPSLNQLSKILHRTKSNQDKAQILYFYVIESDNLIRFLIHEIYNSSIKRDLKKEYFLDLLKAFRYEDGSSLEYAPTTLELWVVKFRTLLREIGVFKRSSFTKPETPIINPVPLQISAGYSYKKYKKEWPQFPIGWIYLFQDENHWNTLLQRLHQLGGWKTINLQGKIFMEPEGDPFALKEEYNEKEQSL